VQEVRTIMEAWWQRGSATTTWAKTELIYFSSFEHYTNTLVANMFWTDAIHSRYVHFRPFPPWRSLYPSSCFVTQQVSSLEFLPVVISHLLHFPWLYSLLNMLYQEHSEQSDLCPPPNLWCLYISLLSLLCSDFRFHRVTFYRPSCRGLASV
jgi:hypothetical protein